jgi:hypothetical protein
MDPHDEIEPEQLEMLASAFREQLMACLEECAQGREGLFSHIDGGGEERGWHEADRLRELALALQGVYSLDEKRNALCDEFLDLCSIHGESNPGERKLARDFLQRIEKGEADVKVGEEKLR